MKKLTRMLMIRWYSYEKELIDFDMINFLTGKTAAGKSTIIDALQLVILGDSSGSYFNKAANQKSVRSLKGYLYGETGDDGDAGYEYLRTGPFTSYVALEFYDTEKGKYFTVGFAADCGRELSVNYRWFLIPQKAIPENCFIDERTDIPYDLNGLKLFLNRYAGKKGFEFYDTNRRYQEVTEGKFGQIKRKYRLLFKKAVPFTPITDIEKFITESICDVKHEIRVEEMQSGIRQYKSLEDEAKRTTEKVEALTEIRALSERYEAEKEKLKQQRYIVVRAEKEEYLREEEGLKAQLLETERLFRETEERIQSLRREGEELFLELEKLEEEYHGSDLVKKARELEERISKAKEEIRALHGSAEEALKKLRSFGENWSLRLKRAEECGFRGGEEQRPLLDRLSRLRLPGEEGGEPEESSDFSFRLAAEKLTALKEDFLLYREELRARRRQLSSRLSELEAKIRDLEKGFKPYPSYVTGLKAVLEKTLFERTGHTVTVSILAELLEVRNPEWRNAVEAYLDRQKFYLLLPEEYYEEALKIYDEVRRERGLYDAGLVDIGKLKRSGSFKARDGSLAEELEAENEDARIFIDYLLGQVMKCERVEELKEHRTSITRSVMLYKNFVARKIDPRRYQDPFIGRKSTKILLKKLKEEQEELQSEERILAKNHALMEELSRAEALSSYEAESHAESLRAYRELPELKERVKTLSAELGKLDLSYVDRLREEIQKKRAEQKRREDERERLQKQLGSYQERRRLLSEEQLPRLRREVERIKEAISENFSPDWIENTGEARFLKEQAQKGARTSLSLRESFQRAANLTENEIKKKFDERGRLRMRYNSLYRMPFDVNRDSNEDYDRELREKKEILLPEYIGKIRDAKEKAYAQFRDDFIAKLKSNVESVREQIRELNESLRRSVFGTDRYHFVLSPRSEYRDYYNMITDPLLMDTGGWNIASESFNKKYQKQIDELFQLLVISEEQPSAERQREYEKNIAKFTDYKTYLSFDLIVSNEQGEEQRLSKTLLKKSGGETQLPFYISLLASFSQVCRIRMKGSAAANTIRLIILDEAFSKMDGERIRESIVLLRRFGLQAIFSAPPDKIPDIAPIVDRNIAVYREHHHSFTRYFDPREIEEETEPESGYEPGGESR